MAGSGYAYRGYSTYSGVPPSSDEWSKTSYASDTDQYLCQPVIVDAEERKLAIMLATPNYIAQGYVTKVQAVVEHPVPLVIGPKVGKDYRYKHRSPPMDEPVKDNGYKVEPWKDYGYKNSFPTKAEPMKDSGYKGEPVKDYKYKTEPVKGYGYKPEPMRDYGYTAEPPVKDSGYKVDPTKDYENKAEPIKDYGYKTEPKRDYGYKAEPMKEYGQVEPMNDYKYANDKWHRPSSPIHDRPQKVEDYTENGRRRRFQDGRQYNNYSLNASTNIPKEPSSDRSVKPPENLPRNGNAMEPTMINNGGWVRPNRATWSTPPPSHHDATLSKSTPDLGTAVENSKEALKPLSVSGPTPRFSVPPMSKTVPKKDAYTETIDSREAARRYNNLKYLPPAEDNYTKTIDSREAVRKYGGAIIG
ncbi:uncharacterized protein LOC126717271 [Quercus robur]|uniref:uncharacterized protein LOC126717271 n=1 Tax=Quercus robur TaxID=38942 RepID=UPI002163A862|nr:uncharacterized protein LOC126717271 [Quercus robur]